MSYAHKQCKKQQKQNKTVMEYFFMFDILVTCVADDEVCLFEVICY